ncbi:YqkE family protein [Cohnella terricola]|uniref:DUF3886 domain-containing protein n=1 Tax=Cohnella terricola TaxID=1289167 RepID=A0A559J647_9BACL|nr:YqkE family protein [Cohnella terricola]TVX95296.1 DUF3886 domain-containing protein [Cohnella terricola]
MAKRHHQPVKADARKSTDNGDRPVTLKDRLGLETLEKLKRQAETLKQEEAQRQETKRKEAEAARETERKRKEQDFEYLLNNTTMDWKQFK